MTRLPGPDPSKTRHTSTKADAITEAIQDAFVTRQLLREAQSEKAAWEEKNPPIKSRSVFESPQEMIDHRRAVRERTTAWAGYSNAVETYSNRLARFEKEVGGYLEGATVRVNLDGRPYYVKGSIVSSNGPGRGYRGEVVYSQPDN